MGKGQLLLPLWVCQKYAQSIDGWMKVKVIFAIFVASFLMFLDINKCQLAN